MWLKFKKKILKTGRVMVRGVLEKHVSGKTRLKFRAGVFIVQKKAKLNRKTFFHV